MSQYLFHDDRVTRYELSATGAAFTRASAVGWYELLFLSFSNLTSVGLSDVLPVLEHARSVEMVEMVERVLYVALVVARMVGLTVVRSSGHDRPGS